MLSFEDYKVKYHSLDLEECLIKYQKYVSNFKYYKERLLKEPDYRRKHNKKHRDKINKNPKLREKYLLNGKEYYKNRTLRDPNLVKNMYKRKLEIINSSESSREKYLEYRRESVKKYYRKYREKSLNRDRAKRAALIDFLGGKCVSCGYNKDIRALELDHINSDGHLDRKRIGNKIYRYYIKNLDEAREKIQILCSNCNKIKAMELEEHNISRRVTTRGKNNDY